MAALWLKLPSGSLPSPWSSLWSLTAEQDSWLPVGASVCSEALTSFYVKRKLPTNESRNWERTIPGPCSLTMPPSETRMTYIVEGNGAGTPHNMPSGASLIGCPSRASSGFHCSFGNLLSPRDPSRVPWKPSCQSACPPSPGDQVRPSQPKSSRVAWRIRVCSCCTLSLRVWRLLFFMFFKRCCTYIGRRKSHSSKRCNRKHLPPTQDTSSRILFPKE